MLTLTKSLCTFTTQFYICIDLHSMANEVLGKLVLHFIRKLVLSGDLKVRRGSVR
jgi:hypothetical protein